MLDKTSCLVPTYHFLCYRDVKAFIVLTKKKYESLFCLFLLRKVLKENGASAQKSLMSLILLRFYEKI